MKHGKTRKNAKAAENIFAFLIFAYELLTS